MYYVFLFVVSPFFLGIMQLCSSISTEQSWSLCYRIA